MAEQVQDAPTIVRRPQVEARVGLRRSTIYQRMADGDFPRPVRLGGRAVGWLSTEIDHWINQQVELTRSKEPKAGAIK
jgi:prophage regulatory protein